MKVFPKKINKGQRDFLSQFSGNLSLLFLGALVIPVFAGLDKVPPRAVVLGILVSAVSFVLGLIFSRKD